MIEKINNTAEIRKQGTITVLNSDSNVKAIMELNKEMEGVRRDYKVKNQNSQNSASQTILNS
jgi:hypothetical protein